MTQRSHPTGVRASTGSGAGLGFIRPAIAIFLTALSLRLLHVWQMRDSLFFSVLMGDSRGYDAWARQIAGGDWLGTEVFYQAPLYPYFLGTLYALVGRDLLLVRAVQAVAGAISCVALGYATARLVSKPAGLIAGLMLALYAPAIFFDGLLQKSVLDVLFACVLLALIGLIADRRGERRWWALLGGVLGALSLTRENALILAAIVLAWALASPTPAAGAAVPRSRTARRARQRRLGLAPAAWLLAGLAAVLVPVAARNYAVGGGFYLTTSQFGSNLFIGNNPQADGSYISLREGRGSPEFERLDATALAEHAVGRPLSPAEVSRYWTDRTLAYIRAQPGDWLRLLLRKTWLLWSSTEMIDTESHDSHAEYSLPLRLLGPVWHFGVLAPLCAIGVWALWPDRRRLWVLYALTAAYAASVVVFFVVARYRYPLVPFVIIFAAAGSVALAEWIGRRMRQRLIVAAAVVVVSGVVANWPQRSADERRAITENNLGTALQEDGRAADAIDRYRRALALDPAYTPALNNLGTALRAAGRVDEALAVFSQALSQDPDAANLHYNLANALMAQGKTAEAIAAYRQALAVNPQFVDAHNNLGQALEAEGRLDEAIEAFGRAVQIDDAAAIAHGNLGNALATKGAIQDALAHLQRAVALAPGNAAIRYDLGSLLIERGSFAAAVEQLREAIRLDPTRAEAHNNLGIALASQGQLAAAIASWQEALRLRPGFADARRNLELAARQR